MFKRITQAGAALVFLLAGFSGSAWAQSCLTNETRLYMTATDNSGNTNPGGGPLPNVATQGKMFCMKNGGTTYATGWQEFHDAGGVLKDFKLGNNHPVDPTETVGSWSVTNGFVTHRYASGPFTWAVCTAVNNPGNACRGTNASCVVTLRGTGGAFTGLLRETGSITQCPP